MALPTICYDDSILNVRRNVYSPHKLTTMPQSGQRSPPNLRLFLCEPQAVYYLSLKIDFSLHFLAPLCSFSSTANACLGFPSPLHSPRRVSAFIDSNITARL